VVSLVRCRISPGRNSPLISGAISILRMSASCSAIFAKSVCRKRCRCLRGKPSKLVGLCREQNSPARKCLQRMKKSRGFARRLRKALVAKLFRQNACKKIAITPVLWIERWIGGGPYVQEYRRATVGILICFPQSSTSRSWSTFVRPIKRFFATDRRVLRRGNTFCNRAAKAGQCTCQSPRRNCSIGADALEKTNPCFRTFARAFAGKRPAKLANQRSFLIGREIFLAK